jgi:hypothetical protein
MDSNSAILAIPTALFAAPLIFGTYAVVPSSGARALMVRFGLLTALLVAALGAGALALLLVLL